MIKKIVTITYKDDTKEKFECIEDPFVSGPFYMMTINHGEWVRIPLEGIARVEIKDTWKRRKSL